MINIIYAALPMLAKTEKMIFSSFRISRTVTISKMVNIPVLQPSPRLSLSIPRMVKSKKGDHP